MTLENAVKEAYKNKPKQIVGYSIDGTIVNLNCKQEDTGTVFPARIFLGQKPYHWDSVHEADYVGEFKDEIVKYLD